MTRNSIYNFSCDPAQLDCNFGKSTTLIYEDEYNDECSFIPYDAFRSPEYQDENALRTAIDNAYRYFAPSLSPKKRASLKEALNRLFRDLVAGDALSFDVLAYGCYKQCYELNSDFIVKFCSARNNTTREKAVYDDAIQSGFDSFFVPSFYSPLFGFWYPLTILEQESMWYSHGNLNSELDFGVDFIIQPKYTESLASYIDRTDFGFCPYIAGEESYTHLTYDFNSSQVRDLGIGTLAYLKDLERYYEEETVQAFLDFLSAHRVCDLHAENICRINSRALLLDWLS